MLRKTDDVRPACAQVINASDDEVGLLFSTSGGENVVADGRAVAMSALLL